MTDIKISEFHYLIPKNYYYELFDKFNLYVKKSTISPWYIWRFINIEEFMVKNRINEMIIMGEHGAFIPSEKNPVGHASVIIFIKEEHPLYKYKEKYDFKNSQWKGVSFVTIGGTSSGGGDFSICLVGELNRKSDVEFNNKTSMQWLPTNANVAENLLSSYDYFDETHKTRLLYNALGTYIGLTPAFNSNSYARGILNANEIHPTPMGILPGWNTIIHVSFFKP
jgi:hypothetical protein